MHFINSSVLIGRITALTLLSACGLFAVDVRSYGARGNGISDDTSAIQRAINACPALGTVNFPAGNYLVSGLTLKSQCSYVGAAAQSSLTLLARNRFLITIDERTDIHITGLVLDARNLGGGISAQGQIPVRNIQVDNCEFRNIPGNVVFPLNVAFISTYGFIDSTIQSNRFVNVAAGISLSAVQNVNILDNSFQTVTQGDGIFVGPLAVPFPSGDNLRIAGNTGKNFARMAIELFRPDPPNGSVLTAPVIENNSFSDWTAGAGMGLSITHGDGGIIRGNSVSNATGPAQDTGIEVIISNGLITGNSVSGRFNDGIAVIGTAAPTITGNTINGSLINGISLGCDLSRNRCASRNALISGNTIINAQFVGIKLDNDWSNGLVSRNTITRTAGFWPGDQATQFSGIHQSPAPGVGVIDSNIIVQDASTALAGFGFCGVRVNSSMPGSAITNNEFRSSTPGAFGQGIVDNTGKATTGWIISDNSYSNVSKP